MVARHIITSVGRLVRREYCEWGCLRTDRCARVTSPSVGEQRCYSGGAGIAVRGIPRPPGQISIEKHGLHVRVMVRCGGAELCAIIAPHRGLKCLLPYRIPAR